MMATSSRSWAKRGPGRFEVRTRTPNAHNTVTHTVRLRTSKIELGLLALSDVAREWATARGAIPAGTVVDLIDTTDGGPVAQLKWLGYEQGTLDDALNVLRANGFEQTEEVASGNHQDTRRWLAGED